MVDDLLRRAEGIVVLVVVVVRESGAEEGGEGVVARDGRGREGGVLRLEGAAVWDGRGREGEVLRPMEVVVVWDGRDTERGVVKLPRVEGVRGTRPLEPSEPPVSVSALMLFISSSSLNSASFSCMLRSTLGSETAGEDSPPLLGDDVALTGE